MIPIFNLHLLSLASNQTDPYETYEASVSLFWSGEHHLTRAHFLPSFIISHFLEELTNPWHLSTPPTTLKEVLGDIKRLKKILRMWALISTPTCKVLIFALLISYGTQSHGKIDCFTKRHGHHLNALLTCFLDLSGEELLLAWESKC